MSKNPDQQDAFIERLRERIESDPDMNPTKLAEKAGLDKTAVRSLLVGRSKTPTFRTVSKIMTALGTTFEEFMGDPKTAEEREILRLLTKLPDAERAQLLGFARWISDQPGKGSRPEPEEKE